MLGAGLGKVGNEECWNSSFRWVVLFTC